jgi:hypothetical protein
MAKVARFSLLRKSGSQVFVGEPLQILIPVKHTKEPGAPLLPPGGVTPPGPEK